MGIDVHLSPHGQGPEMHIWPDAKPALTAHPHGMALRTVMRRQSAPVHTLYDGACELLYAAQQMRGAASERGATPALAATLGCVDAALDALAEAVSSMRREALAELRYAGAESPTTAAVVDREFAELADVLRAAQAACDRTRERTGPLLAQMTLG